MTTSRNFSYKIGGKSISFTLDQLSSTEYKPTKSFWEWWIRDKDLLKEQGWGFKRRDSEWIVIKDEPTPPQPANQPDHPHVIVNVTIEVNTPNHSTSYLESHVSGEGTER